MIWAQTILLINLLIPIARTQWIIDKRDANLRVPELLKKYEYPFEEHKVTTKDGYNLVLHRILSRKVTESKPKVVYLNHGLLGGSFTWILNGPKDALGYLLADAGYDVWMVNNRGNGYSMKRSINTNENYWSFDINELGIYDTPASIDYILNLTGQMDLTFVGHSMGCVLYFILTSEMPDYEKKFNKYIALGPLISLKYTNPIYLAIKNLLAADRFHFSDKITPFNIGPFIRVFTSLCKFQSFHDVCNILYTVISGWTPLEAPVEFLTVLFNHFPSGASSRIIIQLIRWLGEDQFSKYDYGPLHNVQNYLQPTPPQYDFGSANVPKYIFYGSNDNMVLPETVEFGLKQIRNIKNITKLEKFAHVDFAHGLNVRKRVNNKIIKILKEN